MDVMTRSSAIYPLSGWDLTELLAEPSEAVFAARLAEIEEALAAFEQRRGDLHAGMDLGTFLELLRQYEDLVNRLQVVTGYASLWFYADTGSQEALTFRNRARQMATAAAN